MKVHITKDLRVVKVSGIYPEEVSAAYGILGQFRQVEAGSTWGLDGIAEYVAQKNGHFVINKSGISKRDAQTWVSTGKAELID